jgi:molybdenum cofactor synthesis domain-containing protein
LYPWTVRGRGAPRSADVKDRVGAGTPSQRRRGPLPSLVAASSPAPRYGDGMEMAPPQIGRALVVVVDDRVSHGEREDATGPLVRELLEEARLVVDGVVIVPGDTVAIRNALNTAVIGGVDLVVSVGGTGVTPRDVTPEATRDILDRELLGISEALRASGLSAGIVEAGVSRGLAGISGSTLVVNLAGSRAAVRDGMATLSPLAVQIIGQLSSLEI